MKNRNFLAFVCALALGAAGTAFGAPVEAITVTDATTSLTNQIAPMTAVLLAILGLTAVVMSFGWIRRVMH